jgi:hypothetical protein
MVPMTRMAHRQAHAASGGLDVADAALGSAPVPAGEVPVPVTEADLVNEVIVRRLDPMVVVATDRLVMVEMTGRPNSWPTIPLIAEYPYVPDVFRRSNIGGLRIFCQRVSGTCR